MHDMPSQEFTQDDGFVGEGDGEGFVNEPTPRRAVLGANFTQKEDEALCNAWKIIGLDPITGNEQQNNSYWELIHDHYRLHSKRPRTQVSLQHRWQTINADCFKWSCCLAQVDCLNPSGTSAQDKLNIAQNLFMGKPKKSGKLGKSFNLLHCWTNLENDEKWKSRSSNEIPNRRKTPSTSPREGLVVDTDDEGSSSLTPLPSVTRKRPGGRKKAKEMRARGGDNVYKESLDNMMKVRKELANERRELRHKEIEERKEAEEKLAEIEERKVANDEMIKRIENEQKIMFMNPSGLDDKGRSYLELCRDQILMTRGYVGGNGGGGNGGYGNGGGGYGGNGGGGYGDI